MPGARAIPTELKSGIVTEWDAKAYGLSTKVLRRAGFRQLHRSIYIWPEVEVTPQLQYDAAQLTMAWTALASHQTAAQLHGLPVPDPSVPHFWFPERDKGIDTSGLRAHWFKTGEVPRYRMIDGRRVTSIGKTFIDLATELCLFDLVAFADAAIKRPEVTIDELRELSLERGRRHIRKARQAVDLVRPRVDSPPETHLRLLLHFAGLPEPKTGTAGLDAEGEWIATPDLSFPEVRLAIEYDGEHHLRQRKQWTRDVDRNAEYVENGWTVVVVIADHLYRRPQLILDRIHGHLRRLGHPSTPRVLAGEWERYLNEVRLR